MEIQRLRGEVVMEAVVSFCIFLKGVDLIA